MRTPTAKCTTCQKCWGTRGDRAQASQSRSLFCKIPHKLSSLLALQFHFKQFHPDRSLDQLVLQREFHLSNSFMLNLIDFLVLVHIHVIVHASDREQFRVLAGVFPTFLRSSLLSSVSRGSLHSRLSFQCLLRSRDLQLAGLDVSSTHVVLHPQQPRIQMSDFTELHSACNSFAHRRICV